MRLSGRIVLLLIAVTFMSACSVVMAARQPPSKNLDVLATGTPRSLVIGELGQPAATSNKGGVTVDVFSFTQGYSKGNKTGRAIFHGLADVFTIGLWEVVGTPTEAVFDGTKVAYEVTYNTDDKVSKVVPLTAKSKEEAPVQVQPVVEAEKTSP
jgi:hypothetical protein